MKQLCSLFKGVHPKYGPTGHERYTRGREFKKYWGKKSVFPHLQICHNLLHIECVNLCESRKWEMGNENERLNEQSAGTLEVSTVFPVTAHNSPEVQSVQCQHTH